MLRLITAAAILLSLAGAARADGIWDTVPIPRFAPHTKPPELPVFDIRTTYLGVLPAPRVINGTIWPDPRMVNLPPLPQTFCVNTGPERAACYILGNAVR